MAEIPSIKPIEVSEQIITFADGTTILGSGSGVDNTNRIWLWSKDPMSTVDAALLFDNADKTSKITIFYSKSSQEVYEGYTRLVNFNRDEYGKISVCLSKDT